MFALQVILMADMFVSVLCRCEQTSFWDEASNTNQPSCKSTSAYIKGFVFYKNPVSDFNYLEGAECCSPSKRWNGSETLVHYPDWSKHTGEAKWYVCPSGYFLSGLYRPEKLEKYKWDMTSMLSARCIKPAAYPVYYRHCYILNSAVGDRRIYYSNITTCNDHYFAVGLHGSHCYESKTIFKAIKCCSMAIAPHKLRTFEDLKTRIMSSTLKNVAKLADGLGFQHCVGAMGVSIGEDFRRFNDTWKANTGMFLDWEKCKDDRCNSRLEINYEDWSIEVKNITYDRVFTYDRTPVTIDRGTIYNNANSRVIESLDISKTVDETISYSVRTSLTDSHEIPIELNFKIPRFHGSSTQFTVILNQEKLNTRHTRLLNTKTHKKSYQIRLEPSSAASYKVPLTERMRTIQYTATIRTTFSAVLRGVLKGGDEFGDPSSSRHCLYQGTEKNFAYRFGDKNIPFYVALREESESLSGPWLWEEMRHAGDWKEVSAAIDNLTDEQTYEFELDGFLDYVSETKLDVVWGNPPPTPSINSSSEPFVTVEDYEDSR